MQIKSIFDVLPAVKELEKAKAPIRGHYIKVRGQDVFIPRENKKCS